MMSRIMGDLELISELAHHGPEDIFIAAITLVGESGAGKSTICSLIPRFYDITGGSLTIDDVDIKNLKDDKLIHSVCVIIYQENKLK